MGAKAKFILFMMVLLSGCVTLQDLASHVDKSKSEFDGTTQIMVSPNWVGSYAKMGVLWNSKMPKDEVLLLVSIANKGSIQSDKSLHLNINGKIVDLQPIDEAAKLEVSSGFVNQFSYVAPSTWSTRRFKIPTSLIKELTDANQALWRIELGQESLEGAFTPDHFGVIKAIRQLLGDIASS